MENWTVSHIRDLRLCVHACASIPKIRPGSWEVSKRMWDNWPNCLLHLMSMRLSLSKSQLKETVLILPFLYRPQTNTQAELRPNQFQIYPLEPVKNRKQYLSAIKDERYLLMKHITSCRNYFQTSGWDMELKVPFCSFQWSEIPLWNMELNTLFGPSHKARVHHEKS
jgi:hypothetical protein